ncbi:MAG: hypothetical protein IT374_23225 [Polyangiaceae bacterium]|nr:hypothetical protein [Polyangiaceae bacterium]
MRCTLHDAIADLLGRHPATLVALAERAGVRLPPAALAELADTDLSQTAPVELRADRVIVFRDARRRVLAAAIAEVQGRRDDDKPYVWPAYVATLRARLRCPVHLFVVALTPAVERWASRRIELETGSALWPTVLGPSRMPRLEESEAAEAWALAVLSALVHARAPDALELAGRALLAASARADEEERALYFNLIWTRMNEPARAALNMDFGGTRSECRSPKRNSSWIGLEPRAGVAVPRRARLHPRQPKDARNPALATKGPRNPCRRSTS